MYIDKLLQVSSLQALTGNAASTDVIDLGSQRRIIGPGQPMWWVIAARVGLAGESAAFAAAVQTDDASNFPSAVTLTSTGTLSALAAGSRIVLPMTFHNERFLRLNYTVTGTVTVDAWLTDQDPAHWTAMPDGL